MIIFETSLIYMVMISDFYQKEIKHFKISLNGVYVDEKKSK